MPFSESICYGLLATDWSPKLQKRLPKSSKKHPTNLPKNNTEINITIRTKIIKKTRNSGGLKPSKLFPCEVFLEIEKQARSCII